MIKYLKEENFEEEIKEGITLVDFYADWCGPCQRMGTILEECEDINVLKVNTDEHQDLAISFGVMSIPTLILFKDGKEVNKKIGLMSKSEVENFVKSV
mgnify:FL=1